MSFSDENERDFGGSFDWEESEHSPDRHAASSKRRKDTSFLQSCGSWMLSGRRTSGQAYRVNSGSNVCSSTITKMRIIMATYVPLRTCFQLCKLILCGLVLSAILLNLSTLLKRPARLDSADEYSDYDGSVKLRRGNPNGFVAKDPEEMLEAQMARGGRWRRRVVGVAGKRASDYVFSSNLEPVGPNRPRQPHDPIPIESIQSIQRREPHEIEGVRRRSKQTSRVRTDHESEYDRNDTAVLAPPDGGHRRRADDEFENARIDAGRDGNSRRGVAEAEGSINEERRLSNDKPSRIFKRVKSKKDGVADAVAMAEDKAGEIDAADEERVRRAKLEESLANKDDPAERPEKQKLMNQQADDVEGARVDLFDKREKSRVDTPARGVDDHALAPGGNLGTEFDLTRDERRKDVEKRLRKQPNENQDTRPQLGPSNADSRVVSAAEVKKNGDDVRDAQFDDPGIKRTDTRRRNSGSVTAQTRRNHVVPEPPLKAVLMLSYSFDADLAIGRGLNRYPGVFYFEDPLIYFDELFQIRGAARGGETLKRNQIQEALKFLGNAAKCSFAARSDMLLREPRFLWSIGAFQSHYRTSCDGAGNGDQVELEAGDEDVRGGRSKLARTKDYAADPHDDDRARDDFNSVVKCLETACSSSDVAVLRTSRLLFKDLEYFWNARQRASYAGMKLLVLLRDPRAILFKGKHHGNLVYHLDGVGRIFVAARDLCSRMLADVEELERFAEELRAAEVVQRDADFFMVLKEEDFLKNPMKAMRSIVKFIGIQPRDGASQVKSITNSVKREIANSLNITKNWRAGLELQELIKIDEACKHFYKTGYYSSVTTRVSKKKVDYEDGIGNNDDVYNPN